MPCNDVTDILEIGLDNSDRITGYNLIKRNCGRAVGGRSLIINWLKGAEARTILDTTADRFLDAHSVDDPIEEFLLLKHFLSVKEGLAILLGDNSGGVNDFCTVDTIRHGPKGTEIIAHIRSEMMTGQIKACGRRCCSS